MIGVQTGVYHYDLNGRLIAETDGSGQTLAEYVYLGDQLLALIASNDTVYYCHNDRMGTPRVLIDSTGQIAWKASYSPFGQANILVENVQNPFRFAGQYFDAETGLHYNYHRYYDPGTGRYITPDPIGLAGGINPFLYANADPLNWIDPSGLWSWRSFGAGVLKGSAYLVGGAAIGAMIVVTLPASAATALITGGALAGSAALGWQTGQAITGERIEWNENGLQARTMCDDERSKLIGQISVGWLTMGLSAVYVKNITVDHPHGQMGPHVQYGPSYPNSASFNLVSFQPFGHPRLHFGPMAPSGGRGSWQGWDNWLQGPKWRWK